MQIKSAHQKEFSIRQSEQIPQKTLIIISRGLPLRLILAFREYLLPPNLGTPTTQELGILLILKVMVNKDPIRIARHMVIYRNLRIIELLPRSIVVY